MTVKDIQDYFESFWRVREVIIDTRAELGTVNINVKSWFPLFQWNLTELARIRTVGVRVLVQNNWLLGRRIFELKG